MVWLHLVDHLDDLRDPAALPGWLATTALRQCIRVRRTAAQLPQVTGPLMDNMADTEAVLAEDELLLAERHAALRAAKVPVELHLFEQGGHGFGLRGMVGKPGAVWPDLFLAWAKTKGWF